MEVIAAAAAWAINSACQNVPAAQDWLGSICPSRTIDAEKLGVKLSPTAKIYRSGSEEFGIAAKRWSSLKTPKVDVVVVPTTDEDVAESVIAFNPRRVTIAKYDV